MFLLLLLSPNIQAQLFQIKQLHIEFEDHDQQLHKMRLPWSAQTVNDFFKIEMRLDSTSARHQVHLRALSPVKLQRVYLDGQYSGTDSSFYFCNGYQSWTISREYQPKEKIPKVRRIMKPYAGKFGDYHLRQFKRKKGNLHSWSWTYWRQQEQYQVLASLNEATFFTRFEYQTKAQKLRIDASCEGVELLADRSISLFDFIAGEANGYEAYTDFMDNYARLWHQQQGSTASKLQPATGWTSWYYHYDNISEKLLTEQLENFSQSKVPIEYFQIDDGYQLHIGDWLQSNKKFPKGMAAMAKKIHQKGYKAGIWLAPFIVGKNSTIYKEHPDWLMKDDHGKAIKIAYNPIWKTTYYPLDIYHPEARAHIQQVIRTILQEWDYDLIKVDFLFALCLYSNGKQSTAQIMRDGMQLLRDAAGTDKKILGCGVPLASCFGLVDYCRIGNDAHLSWEFGILKALRAHERPSTWGTLTNSIHRAPLSGSLFLNDPDVFILRKKKTRLNAKEQYSMFLVNQLFGALLFCSDDISEYNEQASHHYWSGFPLVKTSRKQLTIHRPNVYQYQFSIGHRDYVAYLNLSNKSLKIPLIKGQELYYDNQSNTVLHASEVQHQLQLKAHTSKCFYLVKGAPIELLGGKQHLFSGATLQELTWENNNSITLKTTSTRGLLLLRVADHRIKSVSINGKSYAVKAINGYMGIAVEED